MIRCALIAAFAVFALDGGAYALDVIGQGRVVRFDSKYGTLVISSGAEARTLRVTPETLFTDGNSSRIAPRTARLVLQKGAALRYAAAKGNRDDVLATVRFDRLPYADTSEFRSLPNLGAQSYEGCPGGLYPGGKNERPAAHETAGLALAAQVRPLNENGEAAANGQIVLLSIGMSNASQVFSSFKTIADRDPRKNPRVVVVDGAQDGMTAGRVQDPESVQGGREYWTTIDRRLAAAGVAPPQVQVVWIKQADSEPDTGFPEYALSLAVALARIVRVLPQRYPNVKLAYLSSRSYAGYAATTLNPEPYAYESGFSVKWLIEEQIRGAPDLRFDKMDGRRGAPWLSWGPYLWANGRSANASGISYDPADFGPDGTHPSPLGRRKQANALLLFLKTDSTARTWFIGR